MQNLLKTTYNRAFMLGYIEARKKYPPIYVAANIDATNFTQSYYASGYRKLRWTNPTFSDFEKVMIMECDTTGSYSSNIYSGNLVYNGSSNNCIVPEPHSSYTTQFYYRIFVISKSAKNKANLKFTQDVIVGDSGSNYYIGTIVNGELRPIYKADSNYYNRVVYFDKKSGNVYRGGENHYVEINSIFAGSGNSVSYQITPTGYTYYMLKMRVDSSGNVWALYTNMSALIKLDAKTYTYTNYDANLVVNGYTSSLMYFLTRSNIVTTMELDDNGNFYFTAEDGPSLYVCSIVNGSLVINKNVSLIDTKGESTWGYPIAIYALYKDKFNNLWSFKLDRAGGTSTRKLIKYDFDGKVIQEYDLNYPPYNYGSCIKSDKDGNIYWMSNYNNATIVSMLNVATGKVRDFTNFDTITDIYIDSNYNIWACCPDKYMVTKLDASNSYTRTDYVVKATDVSAKYTINSMMGPV